MADEQLPRRSVEINADYIRSILSYDPETGLFVWRYRPDGPDCFNTAFAGKKVGTVHSQGYLVTRIAKRSFFLHRLAWLIMTGDWPPKKVDHRDLNKQNNRWANLRLASDAENSTNQPVRANNTSGFKGVSWNKRDRLWESYISFQGTRHRLGRYPTIEQARDAYRAASLDLHGQFSRFE